MGIPSRTSLGILFRSLEFFRLFTFQESIFNEKFFGRKTSVTSIWFIDRFNMVHSLFKWRLLFLGCTFCGYSR